MAWIAQMRLSWRSGLSAVLLSLCVTPPLAGYEMWSELFEEQLAEAEAGDSDAQYEVGIMYLKGQGVEEDRKQAVKWLSSASLGGNEQAAAKLRRMKEQQERFAQLEKDASSGDAGAQYEIGMMYLKGRGVEKDEERARVWLGKASKGGHEKATTRLGILHYRGEGGKVDYKQAHALFDRVKNHSVLAQYYLGELYASGDGVAQDYDTAVAWYKKAADGGFNRARGKIINLQEEQGMQRRRAEQAATAAPAPKPEKKTAKVAPPSKQPVKQAGEPVTPARKPVGLEHLLQKQWARGSRPVDYLPSKVTSCQTRNEKLVCFSEVLTRKSGNQTVEYRVKSVVTSKPNKSYTISYRNLVLDVVLEQHVDDVDQPGGYDDETEQGFRVRTGWTNEHAVDCNLVSEQQLDCTKDRAHKITLVPRSPKGREPRLANLVDGKQLVHHGGRDQSITLQLPVSDFGYGGRRQFDEILKILTRVAVVLRRQATDTEFHTEIRVIAHALHGVAVFRLVLACHGNDLRPVDDYLEIQSLGRHVVGRVHQGIQQRSYPVQRRIDLFRVVEIKIEQYLLFRIGCLYEVRVAMCARNGQGQQHK